MLYIQGSFPMALYSPMLVTKDIDKQVLDYIEPWGKNLVYIAWEIGDSHHHTIGTTPDQSVFGKDMILDQ